MVATTEIKRLVVIVNETKGRDVRPPADRCLSRSAGVPAVRDGAEGVGFEPTMSISIPVPRQAAARRWRARRLKISGGTPQRTTWLSILVAATTSVRG